MSSTRMTGVFVALAKRGVAVPPDIDSHAAVFATIDALIENRDQLLSMLSSIFLTDMERQFDPEAGERWQGLMRELAGILEGGDHPWALPVKTTVGLIECGMGCGGMWCWICARHMMECPHKSIRDEEG